MQVHHQRWPRPSPRERRRCLLRSRLVRYQPVRRRRHLQQPDETVQMLDQRLLLAAAIFVPFYAGFDIARYLWGYNISTRDAASLELVDWLMKRPEWEIMRGKDHFLVAGRITWDFRRLSEEENDWGNKLLFLPAAKNMSMLVVESSPWNANDFGIPYPTYFHPAKDSEVFEWQERMRNLDRKWLFSFAGAPRPDNPKSIRGQIIDQCRNSKVGKLLECDFGRASVTHRAALCTCFKALSSVFSRRGTLTHGDRLLTRCLRGAYLFLPPGISLHSVHVASTQELHDLLGVHP